MPTAITGTVVNTASAVPLLGGGVIRAGGSNAAETFAYYPSSTGQVLRLDLTAFTFSQLYAAGTLPTSSTSIAVSADGATLYASHSTGISSVAADGSSGSATLVVSVFTSGQLYRDTADGSRFGLAITSELFPRDFTPGTASISYPVRGAGFTYGWSAVGGWRAAGGYGLIYGQERYLTVVNRTQVRFESLAGNGVASNSTTGADVYATTLNNVYAVDSDSDGRIYFCDNANRVRRAHPADLGGDGLVYDVTGNVSATGRFHLIPTANRLLVNDSQSVRLVS